LNNVAEYEALITGLEILLELRAKSVEIKGDLELVLRQLTKEYKCVKESLILYLTTANVLLKRFVHVEIKHIPRMENQEVNDPAQAASGYKVSKDQEQEPIEIRNKHSSKESLPKTLLTQKFGGMEASHRHIQGTNLVKILVVNNLTDNDWRKPIVNYLENPDGTTCRKIKYKSFELCDCGERFVQKDSRRSFT
jgi:hypothetical protein